MSQRPAPFIHQINNLRFGEFDLGGVLYHAHYLHLYEMAREAFLRSIDEPYPQIAERGQHLVIVAAQQQFHKPIRYGEPMEVHLQAREVKRVSLVLDYRIHVHSALVHEGWTKMVFVERQDSTFKPTALPVTLETGFRSIAVAN